MKKFLEYLVLLEGPGTPPPPADPGMGGAPPAGNLPGGGPPPPMMGGGGGPPMGMGGPPMGGPPGMGGAPAGGPQPLPVQAKDVWKALELALAELESNPTPPNSVSGSGPEPENMIQNNDSGKRHLMGVPGF